MERVHGSEVVNLDELARLIASGHVSEQRHPTLGYRILNYTNRTVIEQHWNDVTERCRGLVLDADDFVVARPIRKFHNYTSVRSPAFIHTKLPLAYDKVDGSLGIVVPTPDGHIVATRGSFASDQATHATALWQEGFAGRVDVPRGVTLLVEIIYPGNRIVVDYGDRDDLVLLAAIDNRTGADIALWDIEWPGARVEHHVGLNLDAAYSFATAAERSADEGLVLVWSRPGEESYRLKIKHPEYIARHSTIFGLSTLSVWRRLSRGTAIDDLVAELPDELHQWTTRIAGALTNDHAETVASAHDLLATVPRNVPRAEQAKLINRMTLSGLVFALLDGRDITEKVWLLVKPAYEPFRRE